VPVGDLGTVRDSYEAPQFVYGTDVTKFVTATVYGWRLKYPLFVPPGSTLSCVVRPLGQNPNPVRVDVIYICRTWDMRRALPTRVKVPWVSSYESKVFDLVSQTLATTDESSNLDLVNPFSTPLEIARLGGRVALSLNESWATGQKNIIAEDPLMLRLILSTLQMRSSRGFDLIRTPTPFGAVFPYNWRAWDVSEKWSMASREFYRARLNIGEIGQVLTAFSGHAQISIGLTGYHDVPVAAITE
jgi:hypothetical protein